MFEVRAFFIVPDRRDEVRLDELDQAITEAVGIPPTRLSIRRKVKSADGRDVRIILWRIPSFDQSVVLRDVLSRMSGIHSTIQEETTEHESAA